MRRAAAGLLLLAGVLGVPEGARAQTGGICARTQEVRDGILALISGVTDCAAVTEAQLASVTGQLDLANSNIGTLQAGDFDGLTSLELLSLHDNELSSLQAGMFSGLTSLARLELLDNELSSLQAGVFSGLTSLTYLSLNANQLSSLQAGVFSGLTSLTYLSLHDNQLSSLQAGVFSGLTSLEELSLHDNQLSSLPAGVFSGLTSLKSLYLHRNEFSSLQAGVFEGLTSLTYLDLGANQFSSLQAGMFSGLTSLEEFLLGFNSVDPLPLAVSLEKVADGRFRAKAPAGAPFGIVLPVSVTGPGAIAGGATTITIPAGGLASDTLTVTRTAGTTFAVTVDIGTLPNRPSNHGGYALVKSGDLPLEVLAQLPLVLNVDAIAGNDTVNIAEKAAGFTIGGDTGSEGGVTVAVTVGTEELTATSASHGAWSVSVPADASYITGTSVTVTVSASKTGFTAPSDVTRTLTVDLTAPTAPSYTAPASLKVGVAVTVTPSGGAGIAGYSATGLPSGLSIDPGTGVIGGTPDTHTGSTQAATVTVTDAAGNPATAAVTFPAVGKGDQTLVGFSYSAASVTFGSAAPGLTAPTGAVTAVTYSATPAAVCTVNASTGALTLAGVGECVITATAASDADYNEATAEFTVTVQPAGALVLDVDAIAGNDTVNIAEKAAGFTIGGDTGSEGGVAVAVTVGTESLTATSDNSGAWSVSVPADASYITGTSVTVTVSASKTGFTAPSDVTRTLTVDLTAPTAPSYTAPASLKVGVAVTVTPSGGAGIAGYSATGLPSGLSIDPGTGVIGGTPDTHTGSTQAVTVTVTDAAGNPATAAVTFPAVGKGDQTLVGFSYSAASVTFGSAAPGLTAPTGAVTAVTYSATPAAVCTVNASTGALTLAGVGECVITATAASDADYNEATAEFTVTVQPAGALVLNVDAIAGNDTVNIAEKAAGFTIGGDTGSEGGVAVAVTVGTEELTATSASHGAWSVSVPADASYITGTSVTVTVSASKTGFTAPSDVTRTLTVDLTAPTAPSYTAPASLKVGVAVTVTPLGGAGIDAYGATGLPSGLSIDPGTGVIGGTPDTATGSTQAVTVTVTDAAGNPATAAVTFPAVGKGDQTLVGFIYSAASVVFGSAAPGLTAPTGAVTAVTYSATPAAVCTVNASTGALTLAGVGSCVVTATAEGDADWNEATAEFTVTVQAAGALVLNVDAIAGNDTVNIAEKAAGFTIGGDTGSEGGVAVAVTVGTEELTATSDNSGAWSVSVPADASYITGTSVTVTVSASKTGLTSPSDVTRTLTVDLTAPTAPSYTAPASLKVGVAVTMTPSGGAGIAGYGATGLPSGLSIDPGTGVIGGTPDTATGSTQAATVTVTDAAGNSATAAVTFPAVGKGDQTLVGFIYSAASVVFGSAAPTVTAPTGAVTAVTYSATPAAVCTVNASTGALTLAGVGECVITATAASDADYNEATAEFTVTVQPAGALVLNVDAIAGNDTVNIAEKAAGFTIGGDTGSEGGVAVTVTVGTTSLTATSDNSGAWSASVPADASYITGTSVTVTVSVSKTGFTAPSDVTRTLAVDLAAPTAPAYTAPASLKVGVAVTVTPLGGAGIDAYGATGLPSGLSIDPATGVIGGTPDTHTGSTQAVTVTVTDAAGNSATAAVTFPAVAKGDQTLAGFSYSAMSVTFGSAAPTVTAPTGAVTAVTYSATPAAVCTVNASTGALTLAGVGECVITATAASDADWNEATAEFTVMVQAAGALVLDVDAIAGNDTVNIAEKAAGFTIGGDTGSEGGVTVAVTVGTEELTATSASHGAWSATRGLGRSSRPLRLR